MGTLGKLTRRTFLVGSAAIVGGVAFGFYEYNKDLENPLKPGDGATTLNPYLIISDKEIVIITPRAEMGQGVQTTLAALVAEELDVAFENIKTIHGPASATYFNEKLTTTPFPEYQESKIKDTMIDAMEVMGKFMGLQITGGSTSMKDAFYKMRIAGAAARQVMIEAAAIKTGHQASSLKTKDGYVLIGNGAKLSYADLASSAAKIDAPSKPKLKDPSKWRYLGKNMPRVDMAEKVSGKAEFSIDTKLDGMLFASVRATPRLGGTMKSFDTAKASKNPGVKKVVDLGDGVGVIATNTWIAMQALNAISIEWGEAPYPSNTKGILTEIENAFQGSPNSSLRNDGDIEEGLSNVGNVITAEYRVPYLAHATMEPMNAVALYIDGKLTLWAGTQAPTTTREQAAKTAKIDKENVVVNTTFMGGGFGRRVETDFTNQAVKLALAMPGTPIKLTWSREEDMRHDFYRPAAIGRFKGVMGQRVPKTLKGDIASPSVFQNFMTRLVGFAPPGPDRLLVEGAFDQPYGIKNYQINGYISDVAVPVGTWRSVGNSCNAFFHECFLDELAYERKVDPLEMRLELMKGQHEPSLKVLEAVAEMANWKKPKASGIGRGVAFTYSFGSPVAQIIEVREKESDGIKIEKVWCAIDVGTALDPGTIEAQMISGIIYGLSAAMLGQITFENGEVVEGNFDSYDAIRMNNTPIIEVKILENNRDLGGVGEPGTPPSMPALANAIFDLTGKRIRELPLSKHIDFA